MSEGSREIVFVAVAAVVAVVLMLAWPLSSTGFATGDDSQNSESAHTGEGLPDQALNLPDLVIRQLEVWPPSPLAGQEALVTFRLVNRGRAVTDSFDFYLDDAQASSVYEGPLDTCGDVLELGPSESCRVARYVQWDDEGNHRITLKLDPENTLRETIETNNERHRNVRVREARSDREQLLVQRSTERRNRENRRDNVKAGNPWTVCTEPRPEMCTADYNPVCGLLGEDSKNTYSNGCSACSDAGVKSYRAGACGTSDDSTIPGGENPPAACTADAKQCPDGTYVGRVAPSCEFAACPDPVACTQDVKECPDGTYVGRVAPSCEFAQCGGDS